MLNALLQAAAIWYDADARIYRRDLAGRFELHGLLPGARVAPGSAQLDPSLVGRDTGVARLTSAGELTEAVFGHEAVLVPLSGESGVDWVLALFGQVPADADAMLATLGRIAGRQLECEAFGGAHQRLVLRSTPLPAAFVQQPSMGDGEHPGAEARLVALEAVQVAKYGQEDLARQILGLGAALQPQVAGHHRGEGREEALQRPGRAILRGHQHRVELAAESVSLPHALTGVIAATVR